MKESEYLKWTICTEVNMPLKGEVWATAEQHLSSLLEENTDKKAELVQYSSVLRYDGFIENGGTVEEWQRMVENKVLLVVLGKETDYSDMAKVYKKWDKKFFDKTIFDNKKIYAIERKLRGKIMEEQRKRALKHCSR